MLSSVLVGMGRIDPRSWNSEMAVSSREPRPQDDPTAPIVKRDWSGWLAYLDEKGLFPKGSPSAGVIPYELPGAARPAIYEIARLKVGKSDLEVLYLGKATDRSQGVRKRLADHYAIDDSLYDQIVEALIKGYVFVARFIQLKLDEVSEADRLERELRDYLQSSRYPWNTR